MTDERATLPKNMTDQFEKMFSSGLSIQGSVFVEENNVYWYNSDTILIAPVTYHLYILWKNDLTLLERELLK